MMKWTPLALFSLSILTAVNHAEPVVLLEDDFSGGLANWKDLSTAITWGGNTTAVSAFEVQDGVVQLNGSVFAHAGYTQTTDLKTFIALDHQFETPVDHKTHTLTVEFRLRWQEDTLAQPAQSGEGNRFLLVLNHAYPEGGLDLTLDDKYNDDSKAWWARPAYHLRIRGGNGSGNFAMIHYGGGHSDDGEYEFYSSGNRQWWIIGFISGANGVSPGSGDPFPANSWARTSVGIASTNFTDYRYVIKPDAQEIWVKESGEYVLKASMPLSLSLNLDGPRYRYFEALEGLRFIWRGQVGQVYLDHVKVTTEETRTRVAAVPGPEPNQYTLEWTSRPGHEYHVLGATALGNGDGDFDVLTESRIPAEEDAETTSAVVELPGGPGTWFFGVSDTW